MIEYMLIGLALGGMYKRARWAYRLAFKGIHDKFPEYDPFGEDK